MMDPIASVDDATELGYTVSEASLARASAYIRGYTGQDVTVGESTVTLPGTGPWRLPQRPVLDVSVLVDSATAAVSFTLHGQMIYADGYSRTGLTVTYTHGYDPVPDGIIEACCAIASRMGAMTPQMAGLTQVSTGAISAQFGGGAGGLTSGEKSLLDRLFPKLPRTSVLL